MWLFVDYHNNKLVPQLSVPKTNIVKILSSVHIYALIYIYIGNMMLIQTVLGYLEIQNLCCFFFFFFPCVYFNSSKQPKPVSANKTQPTPQAKQPPQMKPPGSSSSRKPSDNKTPATPSQKTPKDNRTTSKSRAQSRSGSSKPRTTPSAGKSKETYAKSSATVRPTSKASASKRDEAKCNTPTNDRPASVGLTTRPSEGLVQVRMTTKPNVMQSSKMSLLKRQNLSSYYSKKYISDKTWQSGHNQCVPTTWHKHKTRKVAHDQSNQEYLLLANCACHESVVHLGGSRCSSVTQGFVLFCLFFFQ